MEVTAGRDPQGTLWWDQAASWRWWSSRAGQGLGGEEPGAGLAWILHAGGAAVAQEHGVDWWLSHKVSMLGGQAGRRRGDRQGDGQME